MTKSPGFSAFSLIFSERSKEKDSVQRENPQNSCLVDGTVTLILEAAKSSMSASGYLAITPVLQLPLATT